MKALHFGAGNIGRGLIFPILKNSGYNVFLADINDNVIQLINLYKKYRIKIISSNNFYYEYIKNVKCINVTSTVLEEHIIDTNLITTSVGVLNLQAVAYYISEGILKRYYKNKNNYLNIIVCENVIRGSSVLKTFVMKNLPTSCYDFIHQKIGFVDSSIDRIVPFYNKKIDFIRKNINLDVDVEEFYEWIIDITQYKGPYNNINGVVVTENLMFFIDRKFYTLNTGHAILSYLGLVYGYTNTYDSINDIKIKKIVIGAMKESSNFLQKKYYYYTENEQKNYINNIIKRFNNRNIMDSLLRIGRNPIQKLKENERLITPLMNTFQFNLPNDNLIHGIAAALIYDNTNDLEAIKLQALIKEKGIVDTLLQILGSNINNVIIKKIIKSYVFFKNIKKYHV
ncbi:Mannitol-1-phosphate 5-dehydrogenase [Buchnera aphidicola (Thelaxes suberi)]|uniref:mannitol-1-phosphate 5-dehydrogenase n=1 Tax=Buchnera aphidicola TaxID=9 RepID=UPI0034641D38